jgi:hypothetical protein
MALRIPPLLVAATPLILAMLAGPAVAQAPDFGTDSSPWARDGECDDPRFEGEGMAAMTTEADRMADATDCRTAFEAGRITLIGGAAPAPGAVPGKGGGQAGTLPGGQPEAPAAAPAAAAPGTIAFGDDSSQWASDGECDDRRFAGPGMAAGLSWEHVGRDATDCRTLHDAGQVRLWDWVEARAATDCAAIDFGDDASDYANSGVCDDPRFEGFAMDRIVTQNEVGHDASDCLQLCAMGVIAVRDY